MSLRANPTAIGLFLTGAIILSIVGIAMLASTAWFSKQSTFISYFGESVNGLERGAVVKFQGVPIGNVTQLLIQIDLDDKTFQVPVRYDIDLERLTALGGDFVHLDDPRVLRQQIADGLRAQLQMESMVTGQLYIELSYRTEAPPPDLERRPTAYPEIPTTPSLMAALGTEAGSLVADMLRVLFQVNEMLEDIDMAGINASVVASAQAVERLVDSRELRAAIGGFPATTEQVNRTMAEFQLLAERVGGTVDPLRHQIAGTNDELVLTLQTMRETVEAMRGMLTSDSGVGYEMEHAFSSMRDAADALRTLALSLDQNPDMLLRGRKPPQE